MAKNNDECGHKDFLRLRLREGAVIAREKYDPGKLFWIGGISWWRSRLRRVRRGVNVP